MSSKYKIQLLACVSFFSSLSVPVFGMEEHDRKTPPSHFKSLEPSSSERQRRVQGAEIKSSSQKQLFEKIIEIMGAEKNTNSTEIDLNSKSTFLSFQDAPYDLYILPQGKAQDLCGWDLYGFSKKKENTLGNRKVASRKGVHFKLSPGGGYDDEGAINELRPGIEESVSSFFQLLTTNKENKEITQIAPFSTLIVFNNIKIKDIEANAKIPHTPYFWVREQFMSGKISSVEDLLNYNPNLKEELETRAIERGKRAVFQASTTIEGEMLETIVKDPNLYKDFCKNVDSQNFSSLFLGTLLTKPSDGGLSNYIAYKTNKGNYGIACIDNDESFVSSLIRFKGQEHFPHLKSVLLFLPMMKEKVDKKIKDLFLSISPEILLYQWIEGLEERNRRYESLLKKGILSEKHFHNMLLPISLRPNLLKELYGKICLIQKLLPLNLTHEEIFKEIEPLVFQYYKALEEKSLNALLELVSHNKSSHAYLEELFNKSSPLPLIGINILQDRDLSGYFSYEALFPDDKKLKTSLQEALVFDPPHNYEEYKQQTVPLIESLRELLHLNSNVPENIFNYALKNQAERALSYLLGWGIGSPQQIISALKGCKFPLTKLHFHSQTFKEDEAKSLSLVLKTREGLRTLSFKTDHRKETSFPTISPSSMDGILKSIEKLSQLTSLTLEGYKIGDSNVADLCKLSQVEDLCLSYSDLKNNSALMLSVRMNKLTHLNLTGNHIEASGAGILLNQLHGLVNFNLSRNRGITKSTKDDQKFFLEELKKHTCLTILDLSHGSITNAFLETIGAFLINHPTLTNLNLNYNDIRQDQSLKGLELLVGTLQELDLGKNNIGNSGALILSQAKQQNKCMLRKLDLSYNHIGEEGAGFLKRLLKENTNLKHLNLKGNSLGGDIGIPKILKGLNCNETLLSLDLSYTGFSANHTNMLFQAFKQNYTLENLNISQKVDIISQKDIFPLLKSINRKRQMERCTSLNIIHVLGEAHRKD